MSKVARDIWFDLGIAVLCIAFGMMIGCILERTYG